MDKTPCQSVENRRGLAVAVFWGIVMGREGGWIAFMRVDVEASEAYCHIGRSGSAAAIAGNT